MIEKMEKLYIYSLRHDSGRIMEMLLKCGTVQVMKTESMLKKADADLLFSGEIPDLYTEEVLLDRVKTCISSIRAFGTKKRLFSKRREVSYKELMNRSMISQAEKICNEIETITAEADEIIKDMKRLEFQKESIEPWKSLDISLENAETQTCGIGYFVLQEPRTIRDVQTAIEKNSLPMYAERIYGEKGEEYIVLIFYKKAEHQVTDILNSLGAKKLSFEGMKGNFRENVRSCDAEISRLKGEYDKKINELEDKVSDREILEMAIDALEIRLQYLSEQENFMHTEKVDIISCWVPVPDKAAINAKLEKYNCFCRYDEPKEDEDFPVLMKNSRLVEPFGAITEMYSLPSPHSIDTNWAIGIFFFVFFGMMLSDAGYGLILIACGALGAAYLDVSEDMKRLMRMISIAGVSTVFWGAVYGSWFGDVISVIAESFFGKSFEMPRLIDPLNDPMTILILSCIFGVVHLFVGMGIKAYILIRRGNLLDAVYDVGMWYGFLIGLIFLVFPGILASMGKIMAIIGAAGLILTQGRHKPTLAGKLISGLISLYGVTNYFSDVLSYSRILALGLATGVIASVVNILAAMAGNGIIGMMLFTAVFIFGHLLNLAINALGAYVHSARLQYVEFFGKYYEGGGSKFEPMKIKTKYVKVTEEK